MHHSHILKKYWTYAFETAVYVINRLPTPLLSNVSPYYKLLARSPSYIDFKVFGYLCYPWLKPYAAHKFDARFHKSVFLGYNKTHKGYIYLDLSTSKIFISRHVIFDE